MARSSHVLPLESLPRSQGAPWVLCAVWSAGVGAVSDLKQATYTGLDGEKFTVEYDPDAPCLMCGLPVIEASMGGTVICPWCDSGYDRQGNKRNSFPFLSRAHGEQEGR